MKTVKKARQKEGYPLVPPESPADTVIRETGYKYMLVIVDMVTRWVEASSTRKNDARTVENLMSEYKYPKLLRTGTEPEVPGKDQTMSLSEGVCNLTFTGNPCPNNFAAGGFRMEWRAPSVMTIVILIVTVLLGVPGNGAVIWVTGFKMKSNVWNVCFLNLAVADLIYCLCLPLYIILQLECVYFWLLVLPTMFLVAFASLYLLCLISIYRCLAITRPIWFQQHLSIPWVRVTCFVVWVIAIVIFMLVILSRCFFKCALIWVTFTFALPPLVIMIIFYALVGWRLQGARFAESRKPIRLIVTAIAAFMICWLPSVLYALISHDCMLQPSDWYILTEALASFNSALNPFIYVFASSDFRQVFRRSLFASLQLAFTEHEPKRETENRNPTSNTNV
ncbi:C3a anaphylatoxin chemotactic receptor-like [Mobula hypostoma]|uniref:C3a anaphylatoxin chemotactic receptor-like n=1 Tax=Mobula hypostoma TaxID=723540 RepID=UPI002FC2A474